MGIECIDVKIQQAINPAAPGRAEQGRSPDLGPNINKWILS